MSSSSWRIVWNWKHTHTQTLEKEEEEKEGSLLAPEPASEIEQPARPAENGCYNPDLL